MLGGGDGLVSKVLATQPEDRSSDRPHAHLKAGHEGLGFQSWGGRDRQITESLASRPYHINELQVPWDLTSKIMRGAVKKDNLVNL